MGSGSPARLCESLHEELALGLAELPLVKNRYVPSLMNLRREV